MVMPIAWVKPLVAEDLRIAAGIGGMWRRYVEPTAENRDMIVGIGEIAAGASTGISAHSDPEVFYITEGEGEVCWRADESLPWTRARLAPGVAYHKAGPGQHEFRNTGTVPLRGIYFKVGKPSR